MKILKKNKKKKISDLTIERLILYSKFLKDLEKAKFKTILSTDIAKHFNIDSAQVRKDLSFIGKLGKRGTGYNIKSLLSTLETFLFINKKVKAVVVGVGNLGSALLGYKIFKDTNIDIVAGFDIDKKIIGKKIHSIPIFSIKSLDNFIKKEKVEIGIITTPVASANIIAIKLQKAGIKGIINFAPTHIVCRKDIVMKNVDIAIFLDMLRYEIHSK